MNALGSATVAGYSIDWALHFVGAALLMALCLRFLSIARSAGVVAIILILKEVVDCVAKSRVEYIRPPNIDHAVDLLCGGLGIAFVWGAQQLKKRIDGNRSLFSNCEP